MKRTAAVAALLFLAGCSGGDMPSGSPYDKQTAETFAMQLKRFRTIDAEKKLHWFQEYVAGYQEPDPGKLPAALVPLKVSSACKLPKPDSKSRLVQVITWDSQVYAPLYSIDRKTFESIARNVMNVVKGNRSPALALGKSEGRLLQVDVAVTETGPVHVVLASTGPVLWNVISAPDARITGISIISRHSAVAIANAPADVPVAVLAGEAAENCGAAPALMPVKDYPGVKMQLHRANDNDAKYADKMAAYRAYNSFFTRQFGVDSDKVSLGVSKMDHAAVGPVPAPDARVPFKSLEGATIRVTPAAFTFYGSEDDYVAAKKAAVIKTASKLTGGDYQKVLESAGY